MLRSVLGPCLLATAALATDPDASTLGRTIAAYLDDTEIVVTPTRSSGTLFDTPATALSIPGETIEARGYRTTPQILSGTPGVMVQETAPGQGSPYIRGFTGFQNLFLIDGIRLNNSVFRPGPNQYWNTVDALTFERLEVVKGPSSVLSGSDAIGGTVQAITKHPYGNGGSLLYRGSTAENSHTGRVEGSLALGGSTGALGGVTLRHFGDLVAGGEVGTQTGTGYDEWDGDFKLEHFLDPDTRLVLAFQQVRQNNVPRTHTTVDAVPFHGTAPGTELQRDSDQERWLLYAQIHKEEMEGLLDALHASISWHDQSEVRHRIRPPSGGGTSNREDFQGFSVGTLGLWLQIESETPIGRLTCGLEAYHDNVNSFSSANPVQGPVADEATYDLLGLYVQDSLPVGERWEVVAGVRFTWAGADADSVSDPATGGRISIADDWSAAVGSVRLLYRLVPDRWNVHGGLSQGFRAPNLSDLTMFDSARSGEFEIPAPGLNPEYFTTAEIGLRGRPGPHRVECAAFYTWIRDGIDRFPNGDTTPSGETVVTKGNIGDGYVYGLELSGQARIADGLFLLGDLTWLMGESDTFATSAPTLTREYITRLMPVTAHLGVRYEPRDDLWLELLATMADKADKLSPGDIRDTQRVPPGGTPGYGILSFRAGCDLGKDTRLSVAVENLLDKAYRVHGSGHTMPGTNFILTLTKRF